jgi:ankyrin repeat protein
MDQGAGFDVKNSDAETPLLLAASINDDMMMRLLLAKVNTSVELDLVDLY